MPALSLVFVTAPSEAVAAELARAVVEEGLAACGNLLPGVRSIYRWEGALCDEAEVLLIFKTATDRVEALRARVVALHPYTTPEVVAVDASAVHAPYLAWVLGAVQR